jgi:hypothetical protein
VSRPGSTESQARQAVPDEVGTPLLVQDPTFEQFRPNLDNNVEAAHVKGTLSPKPDLDVSVL